MKWLGWFNGKKTTIGAVVLFCAAAIEQVGVGMLVDKWELFQAPAWLPAVADVLTWLGLAIAARLVRGHGGRLGVDSSPEQGARFTMTLVPASDFPPG